MALYDYFISYDSSYQKEADKLVLLLEKQGKKCFIASRDIPGGVEYDRKVISSVKNSNSVILLYTKRAEESRYVVNEINTAVGNKIPVIPLRLENIMYSDQFAFYIGAVQFIDSLNGINEGIIEKIINRSCNDLGNRKEYVSIENRKEVSELKVNSNSDIIKTGLSFKEILMKEIEIDFLCIPKDKFNISDEVEGTPDSWGSVALYAEDISCLLTYGKEIIGYGTIYPVTREAYGKLIDGEVIIDPLMIDTYAFGGEFDMYIGMIGVVPDFDNQISYVPIFDWLIKKLIDWKKRNILTRNIGISVYSDKLEKIVKLLGFRYIGLNPVKGKIYETSRAELNDNPIINAKYKDLEL